MITPRLVLTLGILALASCRSSQPLPCSPAEALRAPRNFGQVRTPEGAATAIYRGGQPATCGELEYLRSIGVRSILKLNDRGLTIDDSEKASAVRLGMRMQAFPFSAATIGTAATCDSVQSALSFLTDPEHWPVYVHCTAGKDRTGYIIGMYEKLALRASSAFVIGELRRYGHSGVRSIVMGQIDRELAREMPACAP